MNGLYLQYLWPIRYFAPSIATVTENALNLVMLINVAKIFGAISIMMGERRTATYMVYVHYPLRILLYHNILSGWFKPRPGSHDGTTMAELRDFHAAFRQRECVDEIFTSMTVCAGLLLLLSSPEYQPSQDLGSFYAYLAT